MSNVSVNSWVKRFQAEGIKGLETRPGRGRKAIMDSTDEESVRRAGLPCISVLWGFRDEDFLRRLCPDGTFIKRPEQLLEVIGCSE